MLKRSLLSVLLLAGAMLAGGGVLAADPFRLLALDRHLVKWGEPALGAGASVSYAFVGEPTAVPGARNCRGLLPLQGLADAVGVPLAILEAEIEAGFALWQEVADIDFRRTADAASARILIGAVAGPGAAAYANVAYRRADAEEGQPRPIRRALICFNADRPWSVGARRAEGGYDFRYAAAHEIGHAIGLNHSGARGQLMSFMYQDGPAALRPGDIAGAVALYGARAPALAPGVVEASAPSVGLR